MSFSSTADPLPTDYFPGFLQLASNGSGAIAAAANSTEYILIPIGTDTDLTDVGGCTVAEAHITSGNGSKVLYAILKAAYARVQAESAANRPESLTISESSISGASASTYRQSLTVQTLFGSVSADIVAES
jgi:hypothetical protein